MRGPCAQYIPTISLTLTLLQYTCTVAHTSPCYRLQPTKQTMTQQKTHADINNRTTWVVVYTGTCMCGYVWLFVCVCVFDFCAFVYSSVWMHAFVCKCMNVSVCVYVCVSFSRTYFQNVCNTLGMDTTTSQGLLTVFLTTDVITAEHTRRFTQRQKGRVEFIGCALFSTSLPMACCCYRGDQKQHW